MYLSICPNHLFSETGTSFSDFLWSITYKFPEEQFHLKWNKESNAFNDPETWNIQNGSQMFLHPDEKKNQAFKYWIQGP